MKISIIKNSLLTFASILIIIAIWKMASIGINSDIILPSPESTFQSLIDIVQADEFFSIVALTVMRGFIAFILACCAGIVIGIIIGISKTTNILFKPILILMMSTPVVSFILLALIWFKTDIVPVFVAFLVVFPIISINVSEGIINTDKKLIEMAKIYKVTQWRILNQIYFPSIISYLIAGVTTAIGIGWKVIITTEVLSQPQFAIGTGLQNSRIYLDTSSVFAWTIIAVLISFFFEKMLRCAEKRIIKWR